MPAEAADHAQIMTPGVGQRAATMHPGTGPRKSTLAELPRTAFWAKLGERSWHPLAAHLADVGAVAECLLDGRSVLADRIARALDVGNAIPGVAQRTVVYLACLHDVGKVQHGFQARRDGGAGIPPSMLGHVRPLLRSVASGVTELRAPFRAIMRRTGGEAPLVTTICHHGKPYSLSDRGNVAELGRFWRANQDRDPIAEIERLDALALGWSGLSADAVPSGWEWTPRALHLLAGLLTLADWIGSSERYFEHDPAADADPPRYWERARARAAAACADVGLLPRRIVVPAGTDALAHLFPRTFPKHEPTALQRHIAEVPLPGPGTRLLVESDTGSGKTEAALTLFARLRAAGHVDGMFFALPTRATASAMHARIGAVVERLYAEGSRPAVELATGGRQGGSRIDPLGASAAQYPDEDDAAALERWTSRSTKHAMAAEIVVGTVDQALLAALAARHAHLRLAGIVRHLLIVDEVHAYDRYMTSALRTLTALHTAVGGTVLFMSATLASQARAQLGDDGIDATAPAMEAAIRRPYPSLSVRTRQDPAWRETWLPAGADRTRRVRWSLAGDEEAMLTATAAARRGARVLVLRNTVRDARATLDNFVSAEADALLWRPAPAAPPAAYHSRYTTADREALDGAVLRDFGPGSTLRGVVLVATQVAEQSLDLDFDLLVTDLCPIDVLLQRLGRVHRHRRDDRAGIDQPTAIVIKPARLLEQLVAEGKRSTTLGHGTVYDDLGDLELTRRLVRDRPEVTLPDDCRPLVEAVYHPEVRAALAGESRGWARQLEGRDGERMGAESHAEVCVIRFDLQYHHSTNTARFGELDARGGSTEARVRTRLGDDRARLDLPASVPNRISAHGSRDGFVDLDARVLHRAGIDLTALDQLVVEGWTEDLDGLRFTVGGLGLTYGDRGWSWEQAGGATHERSSAVH